MSQFDSLLDLEDTGTINPPKQQTTEADPFDPFAAPDSNLNGGGGGDLLDLGFDMQVSSQNGNAKVNLEANTNPLYELSNNQTEDVSNNAAKDMNIIGSEPVNPLYDFSNDNQTQDLKSASSSPLYDFLENETTETQTNGHTEDLLGTADSNDVDLLGISGPIVSDDSGVTMDTNHLDGTHEEIHEEQRNGETSEESDIQGKTNVDEVLSTKKEEMVNGTANEMVQEDHTNEGPLVDDVKQTTDQGTEEQDVEESESTDKLPEQEPEQAAEVEPQPAVDEAGNEEEPIKEDTLTEAVKDQLPDTDEPKSSEEIVAVQQEHEQNKEEAKNEANEIVEEKEAENVEPAKEKPVMAEQAKEEFVEIAAQEEHVTEAVSEDSEALQPSVQGADSEIVADVETESTLAEHKTEELQDQTNIKADATVEHQVDEVTLDETEVEPEPVSQEPEPTSQEPETTKQEPEPIKQQEPEPIKQVPEPIQQEPQPVKQEPESIKQEPEPMEQEPEPIKQKSEPVIQEREPERQETVEPDEDTTQSKQAEKHTDSSKDTQHEGALKVNGTSVQNDVGGSEEEPVHFTELSNVRQRFESGASGDEDMPKRHHSVKDDYDEGGEYESTPAVNPDTVKETDAIGEELPEVGMAKNLLSKFQQLEKESAVPKPSERRGVTPPRQSKVEYESTPTKKLDEYVGKSDMGVFESEPSVNEGVIRYGEQLEEEPVLEKGHAKGIVSKFKEIEEERSKVKIREKKELTPDRTGKVEYVSEPRGQSITDYDVKVEAGVFESTPKVEEDVVRAEEKPVEIMPEEGTAKNLLSKFKQLETEVANRPPPSPLRSGTPERAKRDSLSGTRGYLEKYVGKSEEPIEVVKYDEVQEEVMPEAGSAKKGLERFKELEKQSSSPPAPGTYRKEFTPPRENAPGQTMAGVLESTPTERLEGVVKSTDVYETELPEKGTAKNVANIFKQRIESEGSSVSPTSSRGKKEFTPPPEAGVYESVPAPSLVVEQRKAEAGVLESTPTARLDVAKEHDQSPEKELPESGYAKNMVNKFKQLESESAKGSSSGSPQRYKEFTPPRDAHGLLSPKSPAGVSEGVHPSELPGQYQQQVSAGVFENQPETRADLMRESDTDWSEGLPSSGAAKSMKQRFQEMESKALKELETPEPIHRKGKNV